MARNGGLPDQVYVTESANTVHTLVVLDNGFTASADGFTSFSGLGNQSIAAVHDIDRDGDDEIFVDPVAFTFDTGLQLLVLAGCDLVSADGMSGGPSLLVQGNSFRQVGLDCLAPSAAGRGITEYVGDVGNAGQFIDHKRKEWRLTVNDATGAITWTKTRQVTVRDQFADPAIPDTMSAVEEAYRYDRSLSCTADPICSGQRAIPGTPFDDVFKGTVSDDVVSAGNGDDVVETKAGDDLVCAGTGDDVVKLGGGNDRALGQAGTDRLIGGGGDDKAVGGGGNDVVNGAAGADELIGSAGNDTVSGGAGDDKLKGSAGNDKLFGGNGRDVGVGGPGVDACRTEVARSCE
ncbi:MAG: hypothetical protein OEW42_12865 [Acidimicrobiia bacterium]|nr:hypothetical protein [Acidimicrobiia bacterium]MDH5237258.1 hypothetical protein [Acidimicrobiia bacterium]